MERQLEILKAMGCNAVRTAHNPPAPELLDLCDQMGILVQNETFDMWWKRKSRYDYSHDFPEWHERDLTDHILRDRNHPSVFMWSIGNEVHEQFNKTNADTLTLQQANVLLNIRHDNPVGREDATVNINSWITAHLARLVRSLDTTRVVTSGNNFAVPENNLFRSGEMDVYGFNYNLGAYRGFPEDFPGKCFIASETTSAFATRGHYIMPSDKRYAWPETWDQQFDRPVHACSSYDNNCALWGSTHEETWRMVKQLPYCSGLFVWTGFDYLGEPTPFWWPSRSSYFGIVVWLDFLRMHTICIRASGQAGRCSIFFRIGTGSKVNLLICGLTTTTRTRWELFLNGKSLGTKKKEFDQFHVWWRVPFTAGTIKAVSRKNGRDVLIREIHTAGPATAIRLTADRDVIDADGKDMSFITVEIIDKDGNLVPYADNLVQFDVRGCCFVAGVDNGSQTSMEPFKASQRKTFNGKALVVLQKTENAAKRH